MSEPTDSSAPPASDGGQGETRATTGRPAPGRDVRAERYGARPAPRWVPIALLVVVVVAGSALAVNAFRNVGSPPIEGRQTAFEVLDDGSVRIEFQVVRQDPARAAVCVVRARSQDGDETGRKEVYVAPGGPSVVVETVLRTSRRPVTGEVFGCSLDVPAYLAPESQ